MTTQALSTPRFEISQVENGWVVMDHGVFGRISIYVEPTIEEVGRRLVACKAQGDMENARMAEAMVAKENHEALEIPRRAPDRP